MSGTLETRRQARRFASRWDRFLSHPVPLWVLLLLLPFCLVLIILFGSLVRTADRSGRAGAIAMDIATIPRTMKRLLRGDHPYKPFRPYTDGPDALLPNGFWRNTAQPLVDPGYILLTSFSDALRRPVVRLLRLSDGVVVHEYRPDIDAINARSHFRSALVDLERDRGVGMNLMMHPLLMPDGGLVIHDTSPLARVDACGRVEWQIDGIFHHSAERGPDGAIWAVYRFPVPRMPNVAPTFNDEAILKASPEGRTLLLRRISDILDANGLGTLWRSHPYVDDPFHLNDVQPVLTSGPYWQRGDLFLSLRNLSMIALYRPSAGKILWHRVGPWAMQHDVSIIDDHRISVFDNHWRFAAPEGEVDGLNRIPVYDFATDTVHFPLVAATTLHHIATRAQGRATPLPNGDMMVEETEHGRLLRVAPDGTIRWRYISADPARHRYQLRWSRYLDPITDGPAILAAEHAQCA
ncbi:arylsulfotransferase family protein [Flavisphingomonas formosensis]|uniref:arylsulfotransferase family protein n=1 Tax=Flavisphingomonas formosensis TaxID=861534 RepID=UPI0012FAF695|nr:arylsulfotransferase family protein [Sphingomonas formosensis]